VILVGEFLFDLKDYKKIGPDYQRINEYASLIQPFLYKIMAFTSPITYVINREYFFKPKKGTKEIG